MSYNDISLTSGMRANLVSLQQTVSLINRTQQRLSTGKAVNSALDNPVNFFAAQSLNNRASDLAGYKDAMSNAIQTIQAANEGVSGITALLNSAKALASSIGNLDAAGRTAAATQYDSIMTQITNMANDSTFQGIGLIASANNSLTVTFGPSGGDTLALTGQDMTAAKINAGGTAMTTATNDAGWTAGTATTFLSDINAALSGLRSFSQTLSSNLSIIQTRMDFTTNIGNVLTTGADKLTLADTNEEGANMLMLQTRQSLGTTALSLSSQAAQSVLRLFG